MPKVITIDCRELESPEPMVKVLGAVNHLADDQKICMLHRMVPRPLFAKLKELGMEYKVEELASYVEIMIWKG